MGKTALNAYVMFEGNAREALNFYQSVFGGELNLMTYGDMDGSCPAATKDKVMHGQLMGGEAELMGADQTQGEPEPGTAKIQLALSGSDEPKLTGMFNALSSGGQVEVPLSQQAWGDLFGMFADKYGVRWMVNIAKPKEQ